MVVSGSGAPFWGDRSGLEPAPPPPVAASPLSRSRLGNLSLRPLGLTTRLNSSVLIALTLPPISSPSCGR
eukprot:7015730-Alexandrium_andersonii.AAC.1